MITTTNDSSNESNEPNPNSEIRRVEAYGPRGPRLSRQEEMRAEAIKRHGKRAWRLWGPQ